MGTEKCPFCGQEIDAAATRCFFCGAELNEESIHKRLEQLQKQEARLAQRVRKPIAVGIIFVIILISIIFFYDNSGKKRISDVDSSGRSSTVKLNAKVLYPGARFIISNNDSFDWKNVKLEIVSETTEDRFSLKVPNILAGETYTAAAAEFLKDDGIRFNPYTMKPKKFWILCDTPTRENGSYLVGWK
ncbi:MAG: hypothetical protein A2168_04025 [Planctomycetes bacterium RBG_13_50_24]|nr:MAG: hypothetical protein A2168_04025 [Planctomycetes bacterium RBG_13_50_24]